MKRAVAQGVLVVALHLAARAGGNELTAAGGSVLAYPETLAKAAAAIKNVDTVIPGHRPVGTWREFTEYADFMKEFVAYARTATVLNRTVKQAEYDLTKEKMNDKVYVKNMRQEIISSVYATVSGSF